MGYRNDLASLLSSLVVGLLVLSIYSWAIVGFAKWMGWM